MPAVVVIGAQWGDEGKGKVVDLYARYAEVVARYAGGANAGHTLVVRGEKVILHLVPSGALHPDCTCVVGQGVVVDPTVLVRELDELAAKGLAAPERMLVSDRAHVVLPQHKLIDGLREGRAGAIGTTKRGIGPAYEDKVGRRGVRVGDLLDAERLRARIEHNLARWAPYIVAMGAEVPEAEPITAELSALGERLRPHVRDTAMWLSDALDRGARILVEGAQGTMLDVDHGTYPFVTSSNPIAGGASAGTGIGPTAIRHVIGITKAYTTRVGGGPFPTELEDEQGQRLREAGAEYGSTTGRPRRCGWLDAVALRYACRINGLAELALTKLDVLTGIDPIRVCVAYELDGRRLTTVPFDGFDRVAPVYEDLPGWADDLTGCTRLADLPQNAQAYIDRIEELVRCRVRVVSVGPDREHTLGLTDPFDA